MVFSSPVFLLLFFPCFCLLYFVQPQAWRNGFILFVSLLFYALGAGGLIFVALGLLILNWIFAILMCNSNLSRSARRFLLAMGIVFNLAPLVWYKYLLFLLRSLQELSGSSYFSVPEHWVIALPLGISFYVFHFISYIVDVYRKDIVAERSLMSFAIYIFLFPHLIAGPVVRYSEIRSQLGDNHRRIVSKDVYWGLSIAIFGLAKKILIADPLGSVTDAVFHQNMPLSMYAAWLGMICYSFQIYFDFSGYTDMAIGMARIIGFRFPRNFNRPYAARSITEFWKRWHMTLSRFFRDYVYFTLGGNRISSLATYRNLFIVFLLCGMWHGAAYTFLIWGAGHGALLVAERAGVLKSDKWRVGSLPVFVLSTILWVFFRSETLAQSWKVIRAMFALDRDSPAWMDANRVLADPKILCLLVISASICFVPDRQFYRGQRWLIRRSSLMIVLSMLVFLLSIVSVAERGFNPFIYFQF